MSSSAPLHTQAPTALAELPEGVFSLRTVDPVTDLALVHSWMNDPEVARYWEMAQPEQQIEAYLHQQRASGHSTPYLGCIDGTPMSYS